MKTYLTLTTCFLLLFSACKKDELVGPDGTRVPDEGVMTATIDGESFTTTGFGGSPGSSAVIFSGFGTEFVILSGIVDFNGENTELLSLTLYIPGGLTLEERSYSITENCNFQTEICGLFSYSVGDIDAGDFEGFSAPFEGGFLDLNILELDYRPGGFIKGTFSGTVVNSETGETASLTGGGFNVMIIE